VENSILEKNEDVISVEGNENILVVRNSTVRLAREDGIEVDGNSNTVTVENSTINNNGVPPDSPNDGIDVNGAANTMFLEQVTLSSNGEDGLDVEGADNRVTVDLSTVTLNVRDGIINQSPADNPSTVTVHNSIIAGNLGPDTVGAFNSEGYNLIGRSIGFSGPGDQVGAAIDPGLGPLQDNGGPTFTHALLATSPAINAGDPNFVTPEFDQRGPGFPRVQDGRIDIGAVESDFGVPDVEDTLTASNSALVSDDLFMLS